MTGLRRLLAHRRWLAAWLVAAALAVRVLVPGGYMPARPGSLTLMLCSGHMAAPTVTMPMPGMDHGGHGDDHGKADQPCAFAGLALPTLAGGDQPALPSPVAPPPTPRIRALAGARAPPATVYLRPPLRGPPSLG